jgi:outer membrane protein OmpA-like peptidoglycan-associated protein
LAVEIEHTRYARFLRVDTQDSRTLNLTTLVDGQRRAEVRIFLLDGGPARLIHTFSVSNLPPQRAGEPRLGLSGRSDGKSSVHLSLTVNGSPWSSTEIPLRRGSSRRTSFALLVGAALLIAVLLGWLLLRGCVGPSDGPSGESSAGPSTAAETSRAEQPAAQAESDAGERDTGAGPDGAETRESAAAQETGEADEAGDLEEAEPVEEAEEPAVLPEDTVVYFEPNSDVLTPSARDKISSLAEELSDVRGLRLTVVGHCALYGTEQGRIELSHERARRVVRYLRAQSGQAAESWQINAEGLGGKEPVTRDEERQYLNRRVVITVAR